MPTISTKQIRPVAPNPFEMVIVHGLRHTFGQKQGTSRRVILGEHVRFGGELVSYSSTLTPIVSSSHLKPQVATEQL